MTMFQRQRGMSLIELMIAMLLGSMLIAGAVKIFSSNTQAFRLQQQVSSVQETARLTMELLQADLRRAGQGGVQPATQGWNDWSAAGSSPGLLAGSDVLRIRYRAPEVMTDCEGNAALVGDTIVNTYSVGRDTNPDIAALFCDGFVIGAAGTTNGAGFPGVALLRGVESFQVNFGRQGPAPTTNARPSVNGYGSPRAYMRPAQLGNVANNSVVVAIRFGLVVRSEQGIQGMQAPANAIPLLDTTLSAASMAAVKIDNKFPVHRAFVETVALRNTAIGTL